MKPTFIQTITELLDSDESIIVLTADYGFSVFENLQSKYPQRVINTGVTEQATVSIAAGLAYTGFKVIFYAQAAFATMRCFEQLHLDASYSGLNIKVIGVNAGVSLNQLGVSHFSVEDVGIVRTLPGFTIFTPANKFEMAWALKESININGPTYLRFSKVDESESDDSYPPPRIGEPLLFKKGNDAVIFASGGILKYAKQAVIQLQKDNFSLAVYSMPTIKPLNEKKLLDIIENYPIVFTLEEHSVIGGLGSAVSEIIAESEISVRVKRIGIPDSFVSVAGSMDYLLDRNGLSPEKIATSIKKELHKIH